MYALKNIELKREEFSLRIEQFTFNPGELYVISGPNGSGKSTLMDILSLLLPPDKGELVFAGNKIDEKNRASIRKNVAYLMQDPYLFDMPVKDNIAYGLKIRKLGRERIENRCNSIMDKLSISHLAERHISELSGGEKQKAALARTVVIDADLYLFDEPTANIDRSSLPVIEEIIKEKRNQGKTVIISTHSRQQAMRLSGNLLSVINGKLKKTPYENIFTGNAEPGSGYSLLRIGKETAIKTGSEISGKVTVAINPEDIILSEDPIHSSARNNFRGTVTKVERFNGVLQLFMETEPGITFCSIITPASFSDLKLNIGSQVCLTFKATAVKLI